MNKTLNSLKPDVQIVNPHRKKRIKEFRDADHKLMTKYYDLLEQELSNRRLQGEMEKLIKKDPDFYDPYIILADILETQRKRAEARSLLTKGFRWAMKRIVDNKGNFPEYLPWGWLNNRHIVRIIAQQALDCWTLGDTKSALYLYRKLLRSNPNDNIGARYDILAILLGLDANYESQFEFKKMPGYMDALKISSWFEKKSKKFPQEFNWWWKEVKEE